MYSQVFLLLTHSHVHSLQFSPKLFPMEFSLVKARLAKENKMGKKTKQKQQGRESRWLKSKGSDHFKPKATCTYMCTLIPADASIVSVSHLHCSLSSGLDCISTFCLLHMSMFKKVIFWYLGLGTEGSRCGSHFINGVLAVLAPIRQTVTKKQLFCDLELKKTFSAQFLAAQVG